MDNEIVLKEVNGEVRVSSREIAERFGKQNKHVNEAIRKLMDENSTVKNMVTESKYISQRGREETEYLLNRDGFSLVVMGFTGSDALEWKLKYIDAFNKMEQAIHKSLNSKDAAILAIVNADGEVQRAMAISSYEKLVTQPLVKALEEQKPFVDFANKVTSANNSIDMGEMAKLLHEKKNIDIGRNRLFEILRSKKILMSNNTPYQSYIERNWFKLIETTKETQYGTRVFSKVLVTGAGQIKIADIIIGEFSKELVTA